MRRIVVLFALAAGLSTLAAAETWQGNLIDATCRRDAQIKAAAACNATSATTVFALAISGKIYDLDAAGNVKATQAMENRIQAPAAMEQVPGTQPVAVEISGTKTGGAIKVATVEVH